MNTNEEEFKIEVSQWCIIDGQKCYLIHKILGIGWAHYRENWLIPMNLSVFHWEMLKKLGKIPRGAKHPNAVKKTKYYIWDDQ